MRIDDALIEALAEVSADRTELLTHAVRAIEPRRPLEPLGVLCGPRAMEHAMLGTALYRLRPPGTGLTRAAVRHRTPAWVPCIADAPPFSRRALLMQCGIQSGAAFPVMDRSRVAAVIEVLSFWRMERSVAMEALFDHLAVRLARAATEDAGAAPPRTTSEVAQAAEGGMRSRVADVRSVPLDTHHEPTLDHPPMERS